MKKYLMCLKRFGLLRYYGALEAFTGAICIVAGKLFYRQIRDFVETRSVFEKAEAANWKIERSAEFNRITGEIDSSRFSVFLERGSSDFPVFEQIFLHKEYLDYIKEYSRRFSEPETIVDLGANAGYASVFMHLFFNSAGYLIVEPFPRNYRCCMKNLELNKVRLLAAIEGAIWSENSVLYLSDRYGDGREWAKSVSRTGTGEIRAYDMKTLINDNSLQGIDILKIDIENAEHEVFSGDCGFLEHVRSVVMEIHGEHCNIEKVFVSRDFEFMKIGNLYAAFKKEV